MRPLGHSRSLASDLMSRAVEAARDTGIKSIRPFRNHQSLSGAADTLGLSRRAVTRYSSGAAPIPRHIGLAFVDWKSLQ